MDDVDQIVLSSLKEIGYEVKDEVLSLKLCPFEDLVEMAICCLNTIKPELNFPRILPPSMSVKLNMCNQLATICKELGYKGEVGYHTFLYTNVTDVRNVLIFLVQHLPRQLNFEDVEKNENKSNFSIKQKTAEELKKILSSKSKEYRGMCFTPFISTTLETGTLLPNQKIDCQPLEWRDFVVEKLPFVDEQVANYESFLPSLISLNAYGILNPRKPKCSNFNLKPLGESFFSSVSSRESSDNTQIGGGSAVPAQLPGSRAKDDSSKIFSEKTEEREESVSEADKETELTSVKHEIENMEEELTKMKLELKEISIFNDDLKKKLAEKTARESTLDQSLQLLPDSENNIPKLLAANEKVRNKIRKYEVQWQQAKEILLERKTELKNTVNSKTSEKDELVEKVLELRKDLLSVAEQIEKKKVIEQKLAESELKGVQRNEYIQRIFEIIKNIKKQGIQIDKILVDMRYVQKEINTLSGKINRSFALAEQMIVSNSKSDEFSHETHKLLLLLHKDISDILTMTGETGNYSRESKDLEEQLQTLESSENIADSFKQVCEDLKRFKDEEAAIMRKIASIEKKGNPISLLPSSKHENDSVIMDKTGYPVFDKFEPFGDQNVDGAFNTKTKKPTSS